MREWAMCSSTARDPRPEGCRVTGGEWREGGKDETPGHDAYSERHGNLALDVRDTGWLWTTVPSMSHVAEVKGKEAA